MPIFLNNMKLLIVTQAVDTEDPVLGCFVRWIEEFAQRVERIEVICLREGKHDALPANVRVHSLGKERDAAENTTIYGSVFRRVRYAFRFKLLAWRLRRDYDAVFVHMNQEYILIAGPLWKMLGKRVYLWRNHYAGSWVTDVAAAFCTKVFCTSKHSYTARYKKTVLMPVGVDTERFFPDARIERKPNSILFLGRISPSKRPEMLIDALASLARTGATFTASLIGSPLPQDETYHESLKEKVRSLSHHKGTSHFLSRSAPNEMKSLADRVSFHPGVPNGQTPDLYRAHEIFVNASPSGMLDKTLFEAAACGCRVLAASEDFAALAGPDSHFTDAPELALRLTAALAAPAPQTPAPIVAENSLAALSEKLREELYSKSL